MAWPWIRLHNIYIYIYTYSRLHNIMFMATKVHMILGSYVVLTWVRDKRELVENVTL